MRAMIAAIAGAGFRPPETVPEAARGSARLSGRRQQDGEGWLLTARFWSSSTRGRTTSSAPSPSAVCRNHVVGKGMIRRLKDEFPYSNIVAIDYDRARRRSTRKTD